MAGGLPARRVHRLPTALPCVLQLDQICISFDEGKTTMNFIEAALLIQGSACVYSKKVGPSGYWSCCCSVSWDRGLLSCRGRWQAHQRLPPPPPIPRHLLTPKNKLGFNNCGVRTYLAVLWLGLRASRGDGFDSWLGN